MIDFMNARSADKLHDSSISQSASEPASQWANKSVSQSHDSRQLVEDLQRCGRATNWLSRYGNLTRPAKLEIFVMNEWANDRQGVTRLELDILAVNMSDGQIIIHEECPLDGRLTN